MQLLYNLAAILVVIIIIPVFAIRSIREKGFVERIKQSLGFFPKGALDSVAKKKLHLGTRGISRRNCRNKPADKRISAGVSEVAYFGFGRHDFGLRNGEPNHQRRGQHNLFSARPAVCRRVGFAQNTPANFFERRNRTLAEFFHDCASNAHSRYDGQRTHFRKKCSPLQIHVLDSDGHDKHGKIFRDAIFNRRELHQATRRT